MSTTRLFGAALLFAAGLAPLSARAQESKRYDARAIERDFGVAVYPVKPRDVADGDMYVSDLEDDAGRQVHAVLFIARAELKKALAFYEKKLGPPKKEQIDTGGDRYVFTEEAKGVERTVQVEKSEVPRSLKFRFTRRKTDDAAPSDDGSPDPSGDAPERSGDSEGE